jgi:hypothetical protein
MSKKNRKKFGFSVPSGSSTRVNEPTGVLAASPALVEEYRTVRSDLIRVVIVNALFLAGVLALYYTNRSSHYLENFLGRFISL